MFSKITKQSDFVILKKENDYKHIQLISGRQISLFKEKFLLDELIGKKYGSYFKVFENKLVKVPYHELPNLERPDDVELEDKDNRELQGSHSNQKLSKDDIIALRKDGSSGDQIVDQLIENSSTFQTKTEFSQQKYIRRKQKRHVFMVCLLPLTTRHIHEMYFNRGPSKLSYLRMDLLAQILTRANIYAGNNILVYETCSGIIVRSILERMGGFGRVIHLFSGTAPCRPTMDNNLALPESIDKILYDFPVSRMADLINNVDTTLEIKNDLNDTKNIHDINCNSDISCIDLELEKSKDIEITSLLTGSKNNAIHDKNSLLNSDVLSLEFDGIKDIINKNNKSKGCLFGKRQKMDSALDVELRNQRRVQRLNRIFEAEVLIKKCDTNALIIAGKVDPIALVLNLLGFLTPSSPIVIFCPYHEPLVKCYQVLKSNGVLALKITETFFRGYQILNNVTHPHMLMNGNGGYLLTGIKVL